MKNRNTDYSIKLVEITKFEQMISNERYNDLVEMIFSCKTRSQLIKLIDVIDFELASVCCDGGQLITLWSKQYNKIKK
jgi:hypothetical protein